MKEMNAKIDTIENEPKYMSLTSYKNEFELIKTQVGNISITNIEQFDPISKNEFYEKIMLSMVNLNTGIVKSFKSLKKDVYDIMVRLNNFSLSQIEIIENAKKNTGKLKSTKTHELLLCDVLLGVWARLGSHFVLDYFI